jgi:hypothetical protein
MLLLKRSVRVCSSLALLFLTSIYVYAGDQTVVTGKPVTSEDLRNATPVATFTPEEFLRASNKYAQQQRKKGTVKATSDGAKILLDGASFSDDEFVNEIARRNELRPVYCLEIVGPGFDTKRINALLGNLKSTAIETISWHLANQ